MKRAKKWVHLAIEPFSWPILALALAACLTVRQLCNLLIDVPLEVADSFERTFRQWRAKLNTLRAKP